MKYLNKCESWVIDKRVDLIKNEKLSKTLLDMIDYTGYVKETLKSNDISYDIYDIDISELETELIIVLVNKGIYSKTKNYDDLLKDSESEIIEKLEKINKYTLEDLMFIMNEKFEVYVLPDNATVIMSNDDFVVTSNNDLILI